MSSTQTFGIHNTVAVLCELHGCTEATAHFERLLSRAVSDLNLLLHLNSPQSTLTFSTSAFPDYSIHYTRASDDADELTYASIFSFLRQQGSVLLPSGAAYSKLLGVLKSPGFESSSNTHAVACLRGFASRMLHHLELSEAQVVSYLTQCMQYEFAYFSSLRTKIDLGDALDAGQSKDLAEALHEIVEVTPDLPDPRSSSDSLFSYRSPQSTDQALSQPLNFVSSDNDFTKLYNIFLQLGLLKLLGSAQLDSHRYAQIMLSFFKSFRQIEAFNSKSPLFCTDELINLLCGTELLSVIQLRLHPRARVLIAGLLSHASSPDSIGGNVSFANTLISQSFSRDELIDLISNLGAAISVMNEYGLEFNARFPMLFHQYASLVYEELPELATSEDYSFIDEIVGAVESIADFVEHEHTEDAITGILDKLRSVQYTLLEISSSLTLLMRYVIIQMHVSANLPKKILREWIYKTLRARQACVIYEEIAEPTLRKRIASQFLEKWHSTLLVNTEMLEISQEVYESKLLTKFFSLYSNAYHTVSSEYAMKGSQLIQRRVFEQWRGKLATLSAAETSGRSQCNLQLERLFFKRIYSRSQHLKSLASLQSEFNQNWKRTREQDLRAGVLDHWKRKFEKSSYSKQGASDPDVDLATKLKSLSLVSKTHLLGHFFSRWRARAKEHQSMTRFKQHKSVIIKLTFFRIWQHEKQLCEQQELFATRQTSKTQKAVFKFWSQQTKSRLLAREKSRSSDLRRSFKIWRLSFRKTKLSNSSLRNFLEFVFKHWHLRATGADLIAENDEKLVSCALKIWWRLSNSKRTGASFADKKYQESLLLQFINLWRFKLKLNQEMALVADLDLQRRHINLLLSKFSQVRALHSLADKHLDGFGNFSRKITLGSAMLSWKDAYLQNYERQTEEAVTKFHLNVSNPGRCRVIFKWWKKATVANSVKNLKLEQNLKHFSKTSAIKHSIFLHWWEKSQIILQAADRSLQFSEEVLSKRYLIVWLEALLTKVSYLNEIAEEFVGKRDHDQTIEILRKWELKLTKNVTRNQQTCDIFIEKWEKISLRSILQLWSHKLQLKQHTVDEFTEANSSFGSNTSPLAKKFLNSASTGRGTDSGKSPYTPMKMRSSGYPLTPARQGSSPTKLQETNQRIKSSNMEAMSMRFREARLKNTRPSSLYLTNSTRFSPPKRLETSRAFSSVSPPPAPQFDDSGPDATSSPSRPSASNHFDVSRSGVTENQMLESAKKLQIIKPIVIPREFESKELRRSPITKLKERLAASSAGARRASDVFTEGRV